MSNKNESKNDLRIKIYAPEVVFEMGKKASKLKPKGYIETVEDRETRKDLLTYSMALISLYPQAPMLDIERVKMWLEKAYQENPEKTLWHVVRAGGFGGSDMGILYAATEGDQGQSPFGIPREILASKLFLIPIGEDNIHTARGTRMEPYVKDRFLKDLETGAIVESTLSDADKNRLLGNIEENHLYGAKSILDKEMEAKFMTYYNEKHPWLNGNPDDIIQLKDGSIVIVDYKAPVNAHGKIPDYYYAQIHQYAVVFKDLYPELADKVKVLGLAEFDFRGGASIKYTETEFDQNVADKILEIGDIYWNDYVMQNRMPKSIEYGKSSELSDLKLVAVERDENGVATEVNEISLEEDVEKGIVSPDLKYYTDGKLKLSIDSLVTTMEKMLANYSTIRHISREAEKESNEIGFAIKHIIYGKLALQDDTDNIKTPTANISLIKRYDMEKLMPDLQKYWEKLNLDEETLNVEIYNNPRAYLDNPFIPEELVRTFQERLNDDFFLYHYERKTGQFEVNAQNDLRFKGLEEKRESEYLDARKGATAFPLLNVSEFREVIDTTRRDFDIDYLIKFTQRMDPAGGFPFYNYIDIKESDAIIRLRRPTDELDEKVIEQFKKEMVELIRDQSEKVGLDYADKRRNAAVVDTENKVQREIAEAEEKERLKAQKAAEKEAEKASKEAAKEAEKLEKAKAKEKPIEDLGDVKNLTSEVKSQINDEADKLLTEKPKVRKRIIKGV